MPLLEGLCQRVATYPWSQIHPDLRVTVSIGYCDDICLLHYDEMLSEADHYLYQAKARGKNRVVGRSTYRLTRKSIPHAAVPEQSHHDLHSATNALTDRMLAELRRIRGVKGERDEK